MLRSSLLHETVQLAIDDRLLILNSAADPFLLDAAQCLSAGELILAEDNLASLMQTYKSIGIPVGADCLQLFFIHPLVIHSLPGTL